MGKRKIENILKELAEHGIDPVFLTFRESKKYGMTAKQYVIKILPERLAFNISHLIVRYNKPNFN